MRKIAMIPARYASTRFPFKLMQMLGDKTVIRHTYENTVATGLFDEVYVVTDHPLIFDEITSKGGQALMSLHPHESGSDRIAEAVADIPTDIVVNVQGDEPFVSKESLADLLNVFKLNENIGVASLMKPFSNLSIAANPNIVKVVVDRRMMSLLFSRSIIPYYRDETEIKTFYEHIGIYAFAKKTLMQFTKWTPTPLEIAEKIECLRYLENGVPLKMVITHQSTIKIDVPEDLQQALNYLNTLA